MGNYEEGILWFSRNPFLFRGPIPTQIGKQPYLLESGVAIPSYSEVLFLRGGFTGKIYQAGWVAIPSYSEVLFLHR